MKKPLLPPFLFACAMLTIPFAMMSPALGQQTTADVLADPTLDLKIPEQRAEAVAKIKAIEDRRAVKTHAKAKALGLKIRIEKPDGGTKELIDFENGKPLYIETKNVNAAISTNVAPLHSSPYSLDGSGLTVGVWDNGAVRNTHQEFATGSRVTLKDAGTPTFHHTHVAGTIGAAGVSASRKGMAPNVRIDSYKWDFDQSEMTSRAATGPNQFADKIYISNHSYGISRGWDGNLWGGDGTDQAAADHAFGQYNYVAEDLDALHYNAPYYISFWAAGNDGIDNPKTGNSVVIGGSTVSYNPAIHPAGDKVYRGGFEMIADYGIAKNVITVGAVKDAVNGSGVRDSSRASLMNFSSTGPTDDGRIKPDLVANGDGLSSTDSSGNTKYKSASGTSMASPNAAGSAVLLVDQYKRLFNSAMHASTLKALLIHTATDRGNTGPDYKYGWGLINAKSAVDLIIDHHANPVKTRIIENQVTTTTTTRTHLFQWDGSSPLRATVCWTDPAALSTSAHDSRDPRLVNNLNLKLVAPNNTEYFPYVMPFVGTWTVASMNLSATTGINNTDNVEMVNIQSPGQAGTWQAVISYTGALTNSTQAYGLILSGTANTPNTVIVSSPNGGQSFYTESSYPISWVSNIAGNVSIELLKGGVLHSVLSANESNDGSFTWTVPSALPLASDYAIRISSVSNPSYTDTSDATFTIAENPWAKALDTAGILWDSPSSLLSQPWFYQTTTTHDGVDAAQSGAIGDNSSTSLEATIQGPATMTFWWKVSSESNWDFLRFSLNGVEQTGALARISGDIDWVQKTVNLPSGSHVVSWSYIKDGSLNSGSDAGWVDEVVVTPINEVTLSSATYQVTENAGFATITVNRTFGTNGAISVDYATANGTALAGSDYTATSGTLNWADGDLAPKTFDIPITNDSIHEDFLETLTITLSNSVGGILGAINSATLTIQDDDNNAPVVDAGVDQTVLLDGSVPLPWTPANITTAAWYDAADVSTITASANAVSQLNDKSGNANHLTGSGGPKTATRTINGVNVIDFDGTNDQLMDTTFSSLSIANVSIFMVQKYDRNDVQSMTAFTLERTTDSEGMMFHSTYDTNFSFGQRNPNNVSVNYPENTNVELLSYVKTGTTSQKAWLNGLALTTQSTAVTTFTAQRLALGSRSDANYLDGAIGEFIIVPASLSDTDRQKLEGYLAHKWGTTANLPAAHPYKSSAPTEGSTSTATATLSGTASDADNDPMTFSWSVTSQPDDSEVTFADDNALNTTASFTAEGVYVLSLTVSDGRVAISDEVEITVGPAIATLDHFVVSPIASPQTVGTAINGITITAQDAANQTFPSFTGTVSFGGTAGITGTSANFVAGVLSGVSVTPTAAGSNLTFTVDDGVGHTGTASFTVRSLYEVWAGTEGLGGGNAVTAANPDGDSLFNLQEYAFGMDPESSTLNPLTYVANGTATPGVPIMENLGTNESPNYRAVFGRRKDYVAAGLNYRVEFSANLTYWKPSAVGLTVVSGTTGSAIDVVAVPFPATVPLTPAETEQAPPRFFRVINSKN